MGGLALSTLGSLVAVVIGRLNRRKSQEELSRIDRLIGIADEALRAHAISEIEALEQELSGIVGWFVKSGAGGDGGAFSVAIAHARYAIDKQRAAILREGVTSASQEAAAPAQKLTPEMRSPETSSGPEHGLTAA